MIYRWVYKKNTESKMDRIGFCSKNIFHLLQQGLESKLTDTHKYIPVLDLMHAF